MCDLATWTDLSPSSCPRCSYSWGSPYNSLADNEAGYIVSTDDHKVIWYNHSDSCHVSVSDTLPWRLFLVIQQVRELRQGSLTQVFWEKHSEFLKTFCITETMQMNQAGKTKWFWTPVSLSFLSGFLCGSDSALVSALQAIAHGREGCLRHFPFLVTVTAVLSLGWNNMCSAKQGQVNSIWKKALPMARSCLL